MNMKQLTFFLTLALCFTITDSTDILLRKQIVGNMISMSANGNTILVIYFQGANLNSSNVTVYKKIGDTYSRIDIQGLRIYAPMPRKSNRPRLTDDGLYIYFISSQTGKITKGSLVNTSTTNPYIGLISMDAYGCQTNFGCKFALSGDYLALYSHDSIILKIVKNSTIIFSRDISSLTYPYYRSFQPFYQCDYYYYNTGITCTSTYCSSNSYPCTSIYSSTREFFSYGYINSIELGKQGNTIILRSVEDGDNDDDDYRFYYEMNLNTSQFILTTVRLDLAPEVFPERGYSFWSRNSNSLYLKTINQTVKMKRPYTTLYDTEVSKDRTTTQGYSISYNNQYIIQLIQASKQLGNSSNNYFFQPDLKIIQTKPILMFDLNSDGSVLAYLTNQTVIVVDQIPGVSEKFTVLVSQTHTQNVIQNITQKTIEKLINNYYQTEKWYKQPIIYFAFASSIICNLLLITMIVLYIRRKCRQRQQAQSSQDSPQKKDNDLNKSSVNMKQAIDAIDCKVQLEVIP